MKVLIGPPGSGKTFSCNGKERFVVVNEAQLRYVADNSPSDDIVIDVWFDCPSKALLRYANTMIIFELHSWNNLTGLDVEAFYVPSEQDKLDFLLKHMPVEKATEACSKLNNWYDIEKFIRYDILPPVVPVPKTDEWWISKMGWHYSRWKGRRLLRLLSEK